MAVVVSEETGIISIVTGGQIRRDLDGPALKDALLQALNAGPAAPRAGAGAEGGTPQQAGG